MVLWGFISKEVRRARKQNIDYARQHHIPHCWLPAKLMYPANSTKRLSWLTRLTPVYIYIYIYTCFRLFSSVYLLHPVYLFLHVTGDADRRSRMECYQHIVEMLAFLCDTAGGHGVTEKVTDPAVCRPFYVGSGCLTAEEAVQNVRRRFLLPSVFCLLRPLRLLAVMFCVWSFYLFPVHVFSDVVYVVCSMSYL